MLKMAKALWTGFMQSAERFPERAAVFAEARTLSYRELQGLATRIAAIIQSHQEFSQGPLLGRFGYQSQTVGVLGALTISWLVLYAG